MNIVYTYNKCSTCRRAVAWLRERGVEFDERPIRETPPTENELRIVLSVYDGNLRRLFNTSGQDYRKLGLKERLPSIDEAEAIRLLSENGNLVRRPFMLAGGKGGAGFKEAEWQALLPDPEPKLE